MLKISHFFGRELIYINARMKSKRWHETDMVRMSDLSPISCVERKSDLAAVRSVIDPSATLGSTQESARSHLIGGMVRPGGDVLSLRTYVQLPQHVSDELLHVLMATVTEGDARALSVGQWCGGHDPIRVDDDGLIVRLRELHECHERSTWLLGARAARGARNL